MFVHFHPYEPFLFEDTKKMIVGTLPPPRFCTKDLKSCDVDFCYGSCDSYFWKVLDRIYTLNLSYDNSNKAILQRKEFLRAKKIGICDIVQSCEREKLDASDFGIKNPKLRDILHYLEIYKKINTLIFTGKNAKNSPEYLFHTLLKKRGISFTCKSKNNPRIHTFTLQNRQIIAYSLTSPSGSANRFIGSNEKYKNKRAKNPNYTTFDFRVDEYKDIFNRQD